MKFFVEKINIYISFVKKFLRKIKTVYTKREFVFGQTSIILVSKLCKNFIAGVVVETIGSVKNLTFNAFIQTNQYFLSFNLQEIVKM